MGEKISGLRGRESGWGRCAPRMYRRLAVPTRPHPLDEEYAILYSIAYSNLQEAIVKRLQPSRDIQPVSEFRANAAKFIEQVRETKKPLVISQHGRGAAVLVDYDDFYDLMDELEARRAFAQSEADRRAGKVGRPNEEVMQELRERYGI